MIVVNAYTRRWVPTDLGSVLLWLDASQLAGLSDGDPVSSWTDVAGGNNAVQATSEKRPTYRTGVLNGCPVVRFDGGDALATTSAVDLSGTNDITVWAVASAASGATTQVLAEQSDNYNTYTDSWLLSRQSAELVSFSSRVSPNYSQAVSTATLTTSHKIAVGTFDKGLSTNEATMSVNGDGSFTRPLNNNLTGNFGNRIVYIGARNNSTAYLTGDIAEVGICTAALGSTDLANLEGYLGSKYGITVA